MIQTSLKCRGLLLGIIPGLENSTRPLVFTSASGCRASENFDISSEIYFFPYMPIFLVMQGKCLFSDISRPEYRYAPLTIYITYAISIQTENDH